jgi:hypothetical protein
VLRGKGAEKVDQRIEKVRRGTAECKDRVGVELMGYDDCIQYFNIVFTSIVRAGVWQMLVTLGPDPATPLTAGSLFEAGGIV